MNLPTKLGTPPSGDFVGFSFAGIHSSDLGICRTSDGSRYNDTILPTIQDKTIQVPGGDGMYYFGSYFTQKPIQIPIAFDCMSESQYEFFKKLFGDKKIHPLVFDEKPYKTYYVKPTGNLQLKTICFDMDVIDMETSVKDLYSPDQLATGVVRVYKGEGTLSFTAYYPYAESKYNYIEDYIEEGWLNYAEWAEGSNLPENREFLIGNTYKLLEEFVSSKRTDVSETEYVIEVYAYNKNIPINWKMRLPLFDAETTDLTLNCFPVQFTEDGKMTYGNTVGTLKFSELTALVSSVNSEDDVVLDIDTEKRLIKRTLIGASAETSEICNYKISNGDFFELPSDGYYLFQITGYKNDPSIEDGPISKGIPYIDYKYRYL